MSGSVGVNPFKAHEDAEFSESLAEAMIGLVEVFEDLISDAKEQSGNTQVGIGYERFKEDHIEFIEKVREHGLQIADNVQSGAKESAQTDWEAAEEFEHPWELARDINN
ncbi:hypothetical protein ACWGSK_06705 [Nocardiopsis sp. NPDC055551]